MEQLIQLAPRFCWFFPVLGCFSMDSSAENSLRTILFGEMGRLVPERRWPSLHSLSLSVLFVALRAEPEEHIVYLFDWFDVPAGSAKMASAHPGAMRIDTLSVTMMLVVTGVGSLIHMYAVGYMHGDEDFSRFFAYLNLFFCFHADSGQRQRYLVLFVGWGRRWSVHSS